VAGLRSDLDEVLADYRADAGPTVTKDDAFYYVYGLLHSPDYRERYAGDLKAMPPRIQKMRFKGAGTSKDRSTVLYNSHVTLAGIPEVAYPYTLGSRWRSSGSWSPTRSRRTRRRAS